MSTRTLLVLVLAAAFCISALAAGMIVSPGAFMGVNTQGSSSGPPAETFYLLAESGDILTAENGDRLRQEQSL